MQDGIESTERAGLWIPDYIESTDDTHSSRRRECVKGGQRAQTSPECYTLSDDAGILRGEFGRRLIRAKKETFLHSADALPERTGIEINYYVVIAEKKLFHSCAESASVVI